MRNHLYRSPKVFRRLGVLSLHVDTEPSTGQGFTIAGLLNFRRPVTGIAQTFNENVAETEWRRLDRVWVIINDSKRPAPFPKSVSKDECFESTSTWNLSQRSFKFQHDYSVWWISEDM